MLLICLAADGLVWGRFTVEGSSCLAMAIKFLQQADVVQRVIRLTCPSTALICLREQRAITGLLDGTRVPLAGPAADHQSRLFVDREKGVQVAAQVQHGPGGSRLVAMVRSRLPSNRASVVLGQPQSKCACDQKRWQIGHALACGSVEWAATALFGEPGA